MDLPFIGLRRFGSLFLVSLAIAADLDFSHTSAETNLRDYGLAVCVADGYTSTEVKFDASAVASAYLEQGGFPLEAYNDIRMSGRQFLKKTYPSVANSKLILMKCIDFAKSSNVNSIVKKYRSQIRHFRH